MATQQVRRNTIYGYPNPQAGLQQEPIVAQRAPLTSDAAELGTTWVDTTGNSFYILTNRTNNVYTWTAASAGAIAATSMTINPGDLIVTAGNVDITAGDLTMDPASTATFGNLAAGATTITGATSITGNTIVNGNLDVTGDIVITGDFDITSADSVTITSTNDAAGAIALITNGGTSETIVLQNIQGTGAGAVTLDGVAGGVTIQSALNTADAINISATDAAGGIDIDYGTGGMAVTGANGAFTLATGTGAVNLGTDAVAKTITMGNGTGATSVVVNCGTGALNIGTNAIAHTVTIGNNTGATVVAINGGTAGAGAVNIAATANAVPVVIGNDTGATSVTINAGTGGAGAINVGTGAHEIPITIGNITAGTAVDINSGTGGIGLASTGAGDISLSSGDQILLDAVGTVDINSSAAAINIGNDADAFAINMGTGAAARVVTIGNVSGASQVVLNSGTAGVQVNTTGAGDVDVNSADDITIDAAGLISIDSAESSNFTVTGAGQDLTLSSAGGSVVITSSEAVSNAVTIQASNAAGGVVIDTSGLVAVDPATDTQASPTAASTLDFRVLRVIFTGFTTAMGASQDFTITSNQILTTSGIFVNVANLDASTNGALMSLDGVTQAAGSIVVSTTNNGAGALGAGDNVLISVWIIS